MSNNYEITIVGCHKQDNFKEGCAKFIEHLKTIDPTELPIFVFNIAHEKDNKYDPNALLIYWNGYPLGHVSKDSYVPLWEDYPLDKEPLWKNWMVSGLRWTEEGDDGILQWIELETPTEVELFDYEHHQHE